MSMCLIRTISLSSFFRFATFHYHRMVRTKLSANAASKQAKPIHIPDTCLRFEVDEVSRKFFSHQCHVSSGCLCVDGVPHMSWHHAGKTLIENADSSTSNKPMYKCAHSYRDMTVLHRINSPLSPIPNMIRSDMLHVFSYIIFVATLNDHLQEW